jgi:hypothetical protein
MPREPSSEPDRDDAGSRCRFSLLFLCVGRIGSAIRDGRPGAGFATRHVGLNMSRSPTSAHVRFTRLCEGSVKAGDQEGVISSSAALASLSIGDYTLVWIILTSIWSEAPDSGNATLRAVSDKAAFGSGSELPATRPEVRTRQIEMCEMPTIRSVGSVAG